MLKYLLIILCISTALADSPYKTKSHINSNYFTQLEKLQASKQFSFRTFIPGFGGVKFKIKKRRIFNSNYKLVNFNNVQKRKHITPLYQGEMQSKSGSFPVAFSFLPNDKNSTLEIAFLAKTNLRIHKLVLNSSENWQIIHFKHPKISDFKNCAFTRDPALVRSQNNLPTLAADTYSEIELAIDADSVFFSFFSESSNPLVAANAKIDANLNEAEVLYLRDLFIKFKLVQKRVLTSSTFGSSDANDRLSAYDAFLESESTGGTLIAADAYHLFTENITDAAGLAYLRSICSPFFSTGITEGAKSSSSYIFAHELGHNMGADHDQGDANCGTSAGIMSPILSLATPKLFSSCSISAIADHLASVPDCLSDYTGPLPSPTPDGSEPEPTPVINLKGSLNSKGNFTLNLTSNTSNCTYLLKAARLASLLSDSGSIYSSNFSSLSKFFSGRIARKTSESIKLRVDAICNGTAIKSNRITLRADRIKSSSKITSNRWIKRLKQIIAVQ